MPKWMGHQAQRGTALLHNATGMTNVDRMEFSSWSLFSCTAGLNWFTLCSLRYVTTCCMTMRQRKKLFYPTVMAVSKSPPAKQVDISETFLITMPCFTLKSMLTMIKCFPTRTEVLCIAQGHVSYTEIENMHYSLSLAAKSSCCYEAFHTQLSFW